MIASVSDWVVEDGGVNGLRDLLLFQKGKQG